MEQLKILSVNISEKKGTIKSPVEEIALNKEGISGDAHAGTWHRQVSLLGKESFDKMQPTLSKKLNYGDFAENITTEGFELFKMRPLDLLVSEKIVLEITQIGKKCHGTKCAIFKETGNCVMPSEGIFSRVIKGGKLQAGAILEYHPKILKFAVITVSDRASKGIYEDISGPVAKSYIETYFTENGRLVEIENLVIPDEEISIRETILNSVSEGKDVIITTGGTGIGPRDITPDVVKPILAKEIPGIMELIRVKYGQQLPNALISRGIAGTINKTLVYCIPGSPKAVKEYTDEIFPTIEHSLRMLHNIDSH